MVSLSCDQGGRDSRYDRCNISYSNITTTKCQSAEGEYFDMESYIENI